MSFASLPQRWINAAVVFLHQRLVTQYAEQSQQNREAIYRDAHRVKQQLEEGELLQIELQSQVEKLQAENDQLRKQAEYNPFEDPNTDGTRNIAKLQRVTIPFRRRNTQIATS